MNLLRESCVPCAAPSFPTALPTTHSSRKWESFLRNAAGFDEVFNDVSAIRPDEKFWPKIEEGITNCDSFVVVITAASEWAKREVEFARGVSKKVIPIWPRTSVDSTAQKWFNSNSSSRLHRMTSPACGKSECGNLHWD